MVAFVTASKGSTCSLLCVVQHCVPLVKSQCYFLMTFVLCLFLMCLFMMSQQTAPAESLSFKATTSEEQSSAALCGDFALTADERDLNPLF